MHPLQHTQYKLYRPSSCRMALSPSSKISCRREQAAGAKREHSRQADEVPAPVSERPVQSPPVTAPAAPVLQRTSKAKHSAVYRTPLCASYDQVATDPRRRATPPPCAGSNGSSPGWLSCSHGAPAQIRAAFRQGGGGTLCDIAPPN